MSFTIERPIIKSINDCRVNYQPDPYFWTIGLIQTSISVGNYSPYYFKEGSGLRLEDIAIPRGATIIEAHLEFTASYSDSGTTVNTRFTGEDVNNAEEFSDLSDYQARRGTVVGGLDDTHITTAQVDWDNIAAWTAGVVYNSPDLKTIVQEIIDRAGWNSGNSMVIFWDDHDGRSTVGSSKYRRFRTFDYGSDAPVLYIEYENPSGTPPPQSTKNQVNLVIKNPAGETIRYLPNASQIGYDFRVNELGQLKFKVPANDPARDCLVFPNEAWLYIDGVLKDIFKITIFEGNGR